MLLSTLLVSVLLLKKRLVSKIAKNVTKEIIEIIVKTANTMISTAHALLQKIRAIYPIVSIVYKSDVDQEIEALAL